MIIDCILSSPNGTNRAMITMNEMPDTVIIRDFKDDSEHGGIVFKPQEHSYHDVEWIEGRAWWHCSLCGDVYMNDDAQPYKYCPNCGARSVE